MRDPRPFFRCHECGKAHAKAGTSQTSVCVCGTNLWAARMGLPRELTTQNAAERTVVAHVRGDVHDGAACAICRARADAAQAEATLDRIISG